MATNRGKISGEAACELTFEQALASLEEVIRDLEGGRLELTDSLGRYEEGIRLLKYCHVTLNLAERKILLLTGVDSQGVATTEPFEDQALSLEEKKSSRARRRTRGGAQPGMDGAGGNAMQSGLDGADELSQEDVDRQKGLF